MDKISLSFFGEEVKISTPKDLPSLKLSISKEFLLSQEDVSEILIFYEKDSIKIFISNPSDYKAFLDSKIEKITLDISQESKIYTKSKVKVENEKKLKELFKEKEKIEKDQLKMIQNHKKETKQIEEEISKLQQKKIELKKGFLTEMDYYQQEINIHINKILELKKDLGMISEEEALRKRAQVNVFERVGDILTKNVKKIENEVKTGLIDKNNSQKEKKEEIKKINAITKEAVKEINQITKEVVAQSNELISRFENNDLYEEDSDGKLKLKAAPNKNQKFSYLTKEITEEEKEKAKDEIHYKVICDACPCGSKPIQGIRYKCSVCKDFDYCEKCFQENKLKHRHQFIPILKSQFPKVVERSNMKYMQRGIVHRGVRCDVCGMASIRGYRYKCAVCDEFNFCENCEEKEGCKHGHPLIKITHQYMKEKFDENYVKIKSYDNINANQ